MQFSISVSYRYGVSYRPIPITDTDRDFPYQQNRLSADTDTYRLSVRTLLFTITAMAIYTAVTNLLLLSF